MIPGEGGFPAEYLLSGTGSAKSFPDLLHIPYFSGHTDCMFRRAVRGPAPLRGTNEGEMLLNLDVAGVSADEITADDLPTMVAAAAACEPDRIAVTHGAETTTYARLHREVVALDAAMGILLGKASLVPIALATVFPALADTARDDLRAVLDALVVDLVDCVAPEPLSAAG